MTKLFKIFFSALLVFLPIHSLCAFEIPFISGGSETITLYTNDMYVNCNKIGNIFGSYDLFLVTNKNGFMARFTIWDDPSTFTNTMIRYTAIFSNKTTIDGLESYTKLFETNKNAQGNLIWMLVAAKDMTDKFLCDLYVNNQNITHREGYAWDCTYFVMKETIFSKELVFKDGNNRTYKLKLDDKYKDIIHKKIMLYQRKKEQVKKEYENR